MAFTDVFLHFRGEMRGLATPGVESQAALYLWAIMLKRILLHLLLWSAYLAVEFVANLPHYADKRELLRQTLWYWPVIALPFYLVAYVMVPRLLWRQKKLTFWLLSIGVLLLVILLRTEWSHLYYLIFEKEELRLPLTKITKNLFRDYAVIALGVCLKIIRDWDRKDRLTEQLRGEKRDAELQFLRAQIHPHFLFNTLNNLYGLAIRQSNLTPDYILKISELLDFILYECNDDFIPLRREADLIGRYIELETLRYSKERLSLRVKRDEDIPDAIRIAPLLLLPFVENAFKHGSSASGDRIIIDISLQMLDKTLYFQVENSRSEAPAPALPRIGSGKGLGLKNVKKRLELFYPGRHELTLIAGEHNFVIALKIDLS